MLLAATPVTYRSPDWARSAPHRDELRALVAETIPAFEAVAVTHDSAEDTLRRVEQGFRVRDTYRPQLEANGSVQPGEDLADTVFAAMQFRPRGSTAPVLGVERYGDVALHWRPSTLGGATTISPLLSGTVDQHKLFGGGLQAGTAADMVDIVTDALIAQHGPSPLSANDHWLPDLVAAPREQALESVAKLLVGPKFRWVSPEVILRGATATADAIEAVTILKATDVERLDAIRAWAVAQGIPVHEAAAG